MAHAAAPPPGPAVDARGVPAADPTANVIALTRSGFKANKAGFKAIRRELRLHITYQKELALAETNRINAIRAVDVAAVAAARTEAEQRANTLATQVLTLAETLRNTVATTAAQGDANFRDALQPMQTDIRALRDAQSAFVGGTAANVVGTAADTASQGVRRDNFQWAFGLVILILVALAGFLAAHYH